MTDECIRDMAVQAKAKSMTIFLNHRYAVPEDVFGVTTDSAVVSRAQDDKGAIWDLDLDIDLAGTNPRVPKTYELISTDKIKLGVSIGAFIQEYDFKDKDKGFWGGLIIKKVMLAEASIVGIPANQRSWVQNAVIAIKTAMKESSMDADDTIQQAPVTLELRTAEADGIVKVGIEAPADGTMTTLTSDGSGTQLPPITNSADPKTAESDPPATAEPETEPETPDSSGTESGDGSAAAESSGEPSSTEQPTETASATDQPPALRSGEESNLVEASAVALEAAVKDLRAKDATITTLTDRVAALTGERDAAVKVAEAATELIERIATTPLGRKTAVQDNVSDFKSTVARVYGAKAAAALPVETNT